MMAVLDFVRVPTNYLPKLPVEIKIRVLYSGSVIGDLEYTPEGMAEKLGLSRTAVRKALVNLEAEGLVHLTNERSNTQGLATKYYWVEPV